MASGIDYWRKVFRCTGSNVIEAIKFGIAVAWSDCPEELRSHRDGLAALIYAGPKPGCYGCDGGCSEINGCEVETVTAGDCSNDGGQKSTPILIDESHQFPADTQRTGDDFSNRQHEVLQAKIGVEDNGDSNERNFYDGEAGQNCRDDRQEISTQMVLDKKMSNAPIVTISTESEKENKKQVIPNPPQTTTLQTSKVSLEPKKQLPARRVLGEMNLQPLPRKRPPIYLPDNSKELQAKKEASSRKLRIGYQEVEDEKKRRKIQVLGPNDVQKLARDCRELPHRSTKTCPRNLHKVEDTTK